jgi:ABC-type antimicrobial peptide transport system permease subunit
MAVSSLRLRFARSLLTVLTVATAGAFLVYLLLLPPGDDPADRNAWRLMFALSLAVSAAGVLNTMLMSVTQRYREIGTLKCLGALDTFVLLSVLLEAALLGLAGALLGVVAGFVIAVALGALQHGAAVFDHLALAGLPWKISVAMAVSLTLATLGAALPAFIAARMPPMEAMRGEK